MCIRDRLKLSRCGPPDLRLVLTHGFPILAMLRLPTEKSEGCANLKKGGVAVGIDIATGETVGATHNNVPISHHPDTGEELLGLTIPSWGSCLDLASRCYEVTGLGYLGVDLMIHRDGSPFLIETNARAGLSIQGACHAGMRSRYELLMATCPEAATGTLAPEERARISRRLFSAQPVAVPPPSLQPGGIGAAQLAGAGV